MDRSLLSQPEVIAASRDFVCVRLTSYEDADEGKFIKALVRTGSGEVENTAFCLLGPDGKTRLSPSGRSATHIYGGPADMSAAMKKVAEGYAPKGTVSSLPLVANPRLALDVASADGLPL